MLNVFLDTASFAGEAGVIDPNFLTAGVIAMIMTFLAIFVVIGLALYIYLSFAFMALAKKNNQSYPGLAWIPSVGPFIVAYRASNMHWWPWLLLIGFLPIPVIGFLALIVFGVYALIWTWKLYEAVNYPGWWSILILIPIVGLIFVGIAAWGGNKPKKKR